MRVREEPTCPSGCAIAFRCDHDTARGLRRFFDLRRDVNRRLGEYGDVLARAKTDDDMCVPLDISPVEDARLTEVQVVLSGLAGEMRAFANLVTKSVKNHAQTAPTNPVKSVSNIYAHSPRCSRFRFFRYALHPIADID